MRVFTTVPQEDLRRVGAAAKAAEVEGYDGIVAPENQHDPFLALAVAGAATDRIELHTGVAIAFARTPMAVAEVGWGLAGSPGGQEGEKPPYEGQHYRFTLMTPNFTPGRIDAPPPAVMIAAVGPAMLKVAAEECDGVKLHGFCTRKYLTDEIMPRIEAGLAKAGRKRENFEISGGGFLATGPDDATVAKRFGWVCQRVALYGSTPAHSPVLAAYGLEDLGLKLNALVREGKWGEMAKEVPDDVAHLFAAVGRHDQIVGAIERRFGGLVDSLTLRGAVDRDSGPEGR